MSTGVLRVEGEASEAPALATDVVGLAVLAIVDHAGKTLGALGYEVVKTY